MQTAFVKISVSLPDTIYAFLKTKSRSADGMPVSRLVAQAVARMAERESKRKPQTKGVKK